MSKENPPQEIPFGFRFEEPETTTGLRIQVINMHGKPLPHRAHAGDAGYDLSFWPDVREDALGPYTENISSTCKSVVRQHEDCVYRLHAGERVLLPTGMKFAIPPGYYGHIADRSGKSIKEGLHVLGGIIDSTYRGEVRVCLVNLSNEYHLINVGDRIAQILFKRIETACFEEVREFSVQTARGEKGYGSSGA